MFIFKFIFVSISDFGNFPVPPAYPLSIVSQTLETFSKNILMFKQNVTRKVISVILICIIYFQIPKLPDIDPLLQRNAVTASSVMDRPPMSELAG